MARSLSCRHMTAVTIVLLAGIIHSEALNPTSNSTNATTTTDKKSQNATRRIFDIDESDSLHDKRSPVDGLLGLAAPLLALGGGGDGILKSLLGLGLSTLGVGNSDYGGSSYSSSSDADYSQQIHRLGSPVYSQVAYPSQLTQVSINPLEILQTLATKGAMLGSALNAIKGVILGGSKLLTGANDHGNSGYEAPIAVMGPAGYPAYRVPHGVLLKGDGGHSQEAAIGSVRYESGRRPLGYPTMSTHYIDGPLQVPSSNQFRHPFSGFDDGTDGVLKRPPTYDDHQERYPYQRLPTKVGSKRRRPSNKANIGASDISVTSYPQRDPYTPEDDVTGLKGKVNAADKDNQRVVTASYSADDSQIGKTTQPLKNLNQYYPKSQSYKIPVKEPLSKYNTKDGRYDTKEKYGNIGCYCKETFLHTIPTYNPWDTLLQANKKTGSGEEISTTAKTNILA